MEHHQHIRQHYFNFWNTSQQQQNQGEECTELLLKTKAYTASPEEILQAEDDDEGDDPSTCCTICFVPLENGDRVGDLQCQHVFHVECLKGWVQRKNTCPLCAIPLATPRKQPNQEQEPTPNNENDLPDVDV